MQSPRVLLGLLCVAVVSVAALPLLLRAEDPDLALRRRNIAAMTQAERERLERNYARYNAMDAAEQQQLRDFSAALADDQAHNRGRLSETLRIYDQWLQTITPHQRDALRKQTDPLQRIALVRQFVDDQRDERIEIRMGERGEFLGPIPHISRTDLEAMLEVISGKLGLYLTNQQELEGYEGMSRYLKMFELLGRQRRSIRELLSDSNMRQLVDAITDEQTRAELESLPEGTRSPAAAQMRRARLGMAMFQAVEAELDRELRGRRVSPENLDKFFESLTREEQDELLTLTPNQFRQELLGRYDVEREWSQNRITMRLVRQFFRPQRPPGERPPPEGAPGERPGQPPRRRDPRPPGE